MLGAEVNAASTIGWTKDLASINIRRTEKILIMQYENA